MDSQTNLSNFVEPNLNSTNINMSASAKLSTKGTKGTKYEVPVYRLAFRFSELGQYTALWGKIFTGIFRASSKLSLPSLTNSRDCVVTNSIVGDSSDCLLKAPTDGKARRVL